MVECPTIVHTRKVFGSKPFGRALKLFCMYVFSLEDGEKINVSLPLASRVLLQGSRALVQESSVPF